MSIITLTGDNSFKIDERVNQLIDTFLKDNSQEAIERIDGAEVDSLEALSRIEGQSLFNSQKLVIIKDLAKNVQLSESIARIFDSPIPGVDLIIIEPKLDGRSKLYTLLKKRTDFNAYNELQPYVLVDWLVDQAKQKTAVISRQDAQYLINRVGNNQMRLASEIEKLSLYDSVISQENIDLLVEQTPRSNAFTLVEAGMTRNYVKASIIYDELKAQKIDVNIIIGSLAWQLHLLALIKEAGNKSSQSIAIENKLQESQVISAKRLADNITKPELYNAIANLIKLDDKRKTRDVPIDDAILLYLLSF